MTHDVFQKSADQPAIPHRGVLRPSDFANDFTFVHYPPPTELTQYIAYIWVIFWDFPPGVVRTSPAVLPGPQVNLFFTNEGAGVQEVFRAYRTYTAKGCGKVAGIAYKPAGLRAFCARDTSVLTDIFPQVDVTYTKTLLAKEPNRIYDQLMLLLATRHPIYDKNIIKVQRIIEAIEQDNALNTVEAVARRFAKSPRALQALFQNYAGVGVKWVLLRQRLLEAAERIRFDSQLDWTAIAYDLGYSSQSHFITDFKQITGMTPAQYLRFIA